MCTKSPELQTHIIYLKEETLFVKGSIFMLLVTLSIVYKQTSLHDAPVDLSKTKIIYKQCKK